MNGSSNMIPIKDNIKSQRFPVMTIAIIIVNIWIYFQQTSLPTEQPLLSVA